MTVAPGGTALVAPLRRPDSAGFAAWVGPHLAALAAVAVREVGSAGAEDLVQDTLTGAWRRYETFDPERGSARAWLVAILRDQSRRRRRDLLRRGGGDVTAAVSAPTSAAAAARPGPGVAEQVALDDAVARLPERQRQVVVLHYVAGLTTDEIGRLLGVAPSTVRSHLQAAYQTLRASWERP